MTVLKLLTLIVIVYGGVVLVAFVMQRSLMYFPGKALPPVEAPFTAVTVKTSDGLALTAWYARPAAAGNRTIVYFQGNAQTIAERVSKMLPFIEDGYGVLLTGYRGFGGNPGKPTEAGLMADGRAAVQYALDQGAARDRLVLFGESLGTGVAVQLAAADHFAAIILESPFTSAAAVGQATYPYLPVKWLIKDRFDSLAVISRITGPLLIVHGEDDQTTPVSHGRRLLSAAPEPKTGRFLPGAGHGLAEFGATDIERVFLRDVLGRG